MYKRQVLTGPRLDEAKAASLGQTVERLPGVQSSHFGPGVGRPIVRGLDGARVQVLADGMGSGDVSTVSVDHALSIEPFLADQIERLTGYPAAHFLRHDGAFEAICASDEDRAALRAHTERLVRGEESAVVVAIRTASGQMRYLRERTSLTTDETSAFQLAGIFTDVTEQRAAEQALCATANAEAQASRDKSAFIYTCLLYTSPSPRD